MQVTTQILEADRSTLFLHDPKTRELWSRVGVGIGSKEIRFPDAAGIAGSVFTSGRTLNIPDAYQDSRFNPEVDRKTGYRTRNILCMPVVNKAGRAIGVTQVLNKCGGPFTADDEKRLRAFSAQAAIALENAQLFEEVTNARNYNESILKSLSNGVVTLNADRIVIKANEAALKILHEKEPNLIGRPIGELFPRKTAWILDSLSRVARTGTTDLALDSDLELRDGARVSVNSSVEKMGARGTVSMLNSYFAEMVDIVFNHGGILDKYIGDAIMAIFGTPFKKPEDPESVSENSAGSCFRAKGRMARRDEGEYPPWIFD